MKRDICLFVLLLFFFENLCSQQKIFSYKNDDVGFTNPTFSVITIKENDAFLYSQINKNRILRFLWSKTATTNLVEQRTEKIDPLPGFKYASVIEEKTMKCYWRNSIIGGVYKNKQIVEVIRNDHNSDFYFTETNLATGKTTFLDAIRSTAGEKVITCFNRTGKLCLLTVSFNSDNLHIYTIEPGLGLKKMTKEIKISDFGRNSKRIFASRLNKFSEIFNKDEYALYQEDQRYPAILTSFRNKLYILKDKVVITVSSNDLNTYAVILNLENFDHTIRAFDQNFSSTTSPNFPSTSSYLLNNKLLTSHLVKDALILNIFDFSSGEKIRSMKIDESNIDSFTVEIQKKASFLSKSNVKKERLNRFISAAKNNEVSISCYEENNFLYISFAAPFRQLITGSSLLNLAVSAAGTYAINSSPDYYGYMIYSYSGVRTSTYVGFDISFDAANYLPAKREANLSVWDKLSLFLTVRANAYKNRLFFFLDGFYYVSDYSLPTKTSDIYRFDQRGID